MAEQTGAVHLVDIGASLLATGRRRCFFAGIAFLAGFSERFARDVMAAPSQLLEVDKHRGKRRPGAP